MTLTRALWLRSLLPGLAILVAPAGATSLWAQGPDPFRPYNRQYDPYTVPMAPDAAAPGQFVGGLPRSGIRGANQYQNYLEELQGAGRESSERYGIGMPYYRSAVDPNFDPKGTRDYRPNQNVDRSFEESQDLVTRKYLAYFTEKDPKKRTTLLREYTQTRGKIARALSTRRGNQARILETATGLASDTRRPATAADSKPRPASTDRTPRTNPTESIRRPGTRMIPPAPPLFGNTPSRPARSTRTPEDVLNRARRLDTGNDVKADRGEAAAPTPPSTNARTRSDSPPPE
jgi:hypothetical protein